MSDTPSHDDFRQTIRNWLPIMALSLFIAGWGLAIYLIVPDNQRTWNYGVLPDVPGSSIYATASAPPPVTTGRQIALPPDALTPRTPPRTPATQPAAQTQPRPEAKP